MPRKPKPQPPLGLNTREDRKTYISRKILDAMKEVSQKEVIHWHLESPEITEQGEKFNEVMTQFVEGRVGVEEVRDVYRSYVDLHRPNRSLV
jgi:hypothetical protein